MDGKPCAFATGAFTITTDRIAKMINVRAKMPDLLFKFMKLFLIVNFPLPAVLPVAKANIRLLGKLARVL